MNMVSRPGSIGTVIAQGLGSPLITSTLFCVPTGGGVSVTGVVPKATVLDLSIADALARQAVRFGSEASMFHVDGGQCDPFFVEGGDMIGRRSRFAGDGSGLRAESTGSVSSWEQLTPEGLQNAYVARTGDDSLTEEEMFDQTLRDIAARGAPEDRERAGKFLRLLAVKGEKDVTGAVAELTHVLDGLARDPHVGSIGRRLVGPLSRIWGFHDLPFKCGRRISDGGFEAILRNVYNLNVAVLSVMLVVDEDRGLGWLGVNRSDLRADGYVNPRSGDFSLARGGGVDICFYASLRALRRMLPSRTLRTIADRLEYIAIHQHEWKHLRAAHSNDYGANAVEGLIILDPRNLSDRLAKILIDKKYYDNDGRSFFQQTIFLDVIMRYVKRHFGKFNQDQRDGMAERLCNVFLDFERLQKERGRSVLDEKYRNQIIDTLIELCPTDLKRILGRLDDSYARKRAAELIGVLQGLE